jgi:hypothetical protein
MEDMRFPAWEDKEAKKSMVYQAMKCLIRDNDIGEYL